MRTFVPMVLCAALLAACDAVPRIDAGLLPAPIDGAVPHDGAVDGGPTPEPPYDGGPRGGACARDTDCPLGVPCVNAVCGTCCDGVACEASLECSEDCACVPSCAFVGCDLGERCTSGGCVAEGR
ncbi:MAG: hypothetical protein KC619_05985 [Myxococcales bacterium]|nr:hypothetical protein [Myxococcales bacterium]